MPRYIDADALMEKIIKNSYHVRDYWNDTGSGMFLFGIEQAVNEMSTADVQPVKHGKWIKIIEDFDVDEPLAGRCSVCGWSAGIYEEDVVGMDYCPNCGAKMDGENDG